MSVSFITEPVIILKMKTNIYKYFIEIVKNKYPQKRKRKYTFEYYLENFVYVSLHH